MAELVQEGEHDASGKRVGPVRVALPVQTVETANESPQGRDRNHLEKWTDGRNRPIGGEEKHVPPRRVSEAAP